MGGPLGNHFRPRARPVGVPSPPKGAERGAAILWREGARGRQRLTIASLWFGGAAATITTTTMLSARLAAALARSLPRQAGLVSTAT